MALSMTPLIREKSLVLLKLSAHYVQRDLTPLEASLTSGFCCRQVTNQTTCNYPELKLQQNHKYYAQVQGQMGVGGMKWCDLSFAPTKVLMWRGYCTMMMIGRRLSLQNWSHFLITV